jgi:hypothetical protein
VLGPGHQNVHTIFCGCATRTLFVQLTAYRVLDLLTATPGGLIAFIMRLPAAQRFVDLWYPTATPY